MRVSVEIHHRSCANVNRVLTSKHLISSLLGSAVREADLGIVLNPFLFRPGTCGRGPPTSINSRHMTRVLKDSVPEGHLGTEGVKCRALGLALHA